MQLLPGERSILAFFASSNDALQAAKALNNAGYDRPQIDRVSRYGVNYDDNFNNPINRAIAETGPTLFSDGDGKDLSDSERILLAADPSVSGYGNTDYGVAGSKSILLTLVTTEQKIKIAEEIIEQYGGAL